MHGSKMKEKSGASCLLAEIIIECVFYSLWER